MHRRIFSSLNIIRKQIHKFISFELFRFSLQPRLTTQKCQCVNGGKTSSFHSDGNWNVHWRNCNCCILHANYTDKTVRAWISAPHAHTFQCGTSGGFSQRSKPIISEHYNMYKWLLLWKTLKTQANFIFMISPAVPFFWANSAHWMPHWKCGKCWKVN